MRTRSWGLGLLTALGVLLACGLVLAITKTEVRKQMEGVKQAYQRGLMSEERYKQKMAMLEEKLKTAPDVEPPVVETDEPVNLIQNGSFEDFNPNSEPNRSRWLWWGGWSWGGDYENNKAGEAEDGKLCAQIKCTGQAGRIGLMTPDIPVLKKQADYELTLWIKGTPGNRLNVAFESGAGGNGAFTGGDKWEKVTVKGKADAGADKFRIYFYVVGTGTIWLDNVQLMQK